MTDKPVFKTVRIRFNTAYPLQSDKKWRLLVNDTEQLADHIEVAGKVFTSTEEVTGHGIKHHISCNAASIEVEEENKQITVRIVTA
ncbi:hypothetical protein [Sediminibacterium ginsengisoli]|uniref:Uncharacterized protein n=1 Tax=Sediminibacterium ginsengisoli TaxID=413434 RepID=A0A1T4QCP1_9BACT|nr:hypothetical protein [Sediminibacterium ginsengisoli]SKA01512.1 hypothetical protein SAMN04488132_10852 [Sediminibacterium ginsengisoli]